MEVLKGLIKSERRKYKVQLLEDMLGTRAKSEDIHKDWILSKKPFDAEQDNELETIDLGEKGWTGFAKDEKGKGLFLFDYLIKGFLKNAANVNKHLIVKRKVSKKGDVTENGLTAPKSKFDSYVFVEPRRIYLHKMEPDSVNTRPIRVDGPLGPRVAIIKSDSVDAGTIFEFVIEVKENPFVTSDIVEMLLEYGESVGFGQFRNGGYGRFKVIDRIW